MLGPVGVCCLLAVSVSGADATRGTLEVMARALDNCGGWSELGNCLKVKAVTLLDRALSSGPIPITDYLELVPESGVNISSRALSEAELQTQLPKDSLEKEAALDEMIVDKASTLISSRSIKFNLFGETEDNASEEGRKKDKDKKGMGAMMAMFGAMMVQAALAKLALLAGKALIVSKMALLLAGIVGLKKLLGGGGGESTQVVYAHGGHEGGGGGDWGRTGHQLAYSAHARTN